MLGKVYWLLTLNSTWLTVFCASPDFDRGNPRYILLASAKRPFKGNSSLYVQLLTIRLIHLSNSSQVKTLHIRVRVMVKSCLSCYITFGILMYALIPVSYSIFPVTSHDFLFVMYTCRIIHYNVSIILNAPIEFYISTADISKVFVEIIKTLLTFRLTPFISYMCCSSRNKTHA